MSSELRTVGRHTLVYGAGAILGRLASFIMLPVYTRFLTPADYGVLELLGTTVDVVAMIAGLGLAAGVFKEYAALEDERERDRMVSTVALASGGLALLTAAAGVLAAPLLAGSVLGNAGQAGYFRVFFLIYFLQSLCGVPFLLVQAEQRSMLYVWLNAGKLVFQLALNIWFVVYLRMGVAGVLAGNAIASGVVGVGMTAWVFRRVGVAFSAAAFRRLRAFGTPLVVWSLASFVMTFSDRYFLAHFADQATVGLYSLAYKFSFLLSAFAVTPFLQVWEPRRFVVARRDDGGEVVRRVFLWFNLALGLGAVGLVLLTRDLLVVMSSPAFVAAAAVVPLLLAATVLQQWTAFCNLGLYLRDRTSVYAATGLVGVAAVTALNFALIPRWGMWGAAWATLGAYAVRFAAVYVAAQRVHPIDFGWARVARLGAVLGGALAVRAPPPLPAGPASAAASLVVLACAAGGVYAVVLTADERASLRRLIRRPVAALVPEPA